MVGEMYSRGAIYSGFLSAFISYYQGRCEHRLTAILMSDWWQQIYFNINITRKMSALLVSRLPLPKKRSRVVLVFTTVISPNWILGLVSKCFELLNRSRQILVFKVKLFKIAQRVKLSHSDPVFCQPIKLSAELIQIGHYRSINNKSDLIRQCLARRLAYLPIIFFKECQNIFARIQV